MGKEKVPMTSVRVAPAIGEAARELVRGVSTMTVSAGIRRAISAVTEDPRKALEWVIRRYGDPHTAVGVDKPLYWQRGMFCPAGAAITIAVSGFTPKLKAFADAYGYGSISRGVTFAVEYASLREQFPEPEYIHGGEANAPRRYQVYTLDQHVELFQGNSISQLIYLRGQHKLKADRLQGREAVAALPGHPDYDWLR